MLVGHYAGTRLRELRPRLSLDGLTDSVHGREGVLRLLYLSGGTIPDRGYYNLRLEDSRAKIGELDEEFVWERSIGDTFALGALRAAKWLAQQKPGRYGMSDVLGLK